jgi:hypothetical protein
MRALAADQPELPDLHGRHEAAPHGPLARLIGRLTALLELVCTAEELPAVRATALVVVSLAVGWAGGVTVALAAH